MNIRVIMIILLLFSLAVPGTSRASLDASKSVNYVLADDLSGVKVAIFNGSTTEISASCKNASEAMFEWMNATVEFITEDDISDNRLYFYDILVFPPGDLAEYSIKLGSSGKAKIREYITNGGSYIGISRGAHFACEVANVYGVQNEWGLNLFSGTGIGPVDGYLDQHMYEVDINKTIPGLDLSSIPDTLTMMGWESIRFAPDENPPLNVIATFPSNDQPGMISYQYGSGCVFLSGIHPEFEEDGDRDNTYYFDAHEDPETDWPLMNEISQWLVATSTWDNASIPTTSSTTTTTATTSTNTTTNGQPMAIEPLLLAGGIGVVVILLIAVAIFKKR
ncbi:MAG: BPL-N domain-containing protein [Candidatus Thorarchaeota archaeon]